MHEFVLSGRRLRKHGVKTLDVASACSISASTRPSVFPLIVDEAMMIEPTETETLDRSTTSPDAWSRSAAKRRRIHKLLLDARSPPP